MCWTQDASEFSNLGTQENTVVLQVTREDNTRSKQQGPGDDPGEGTLRRQEGCKQIPGEVLTFKNVKLLAKNDSQCDCRNVRTVKTFQI